jgi:hypothetical protein
MIASILTILAALVPFLILLWKRRAQREEDPYEHWIHDRTNTNRD